MDAPSACDSAKGRQERPMPPRKACDGCFRRKIRCLLPQSGSPCDWCKNQRISCTFARESQSSHRLSPTAVQDLLNRVEQLEAELASKNAQALTPASIPAQRTPGADRYQETVPSNSPAGTFSQATPFSSHEASFPSNPVSPPVLQDRISRSEATFETWVGCGWFLRGLPILSRDGEKWLSAKTGQNVTFEHLSPPRQPTRGATIREAEIIKLPEEWEVRELAKVYFESSLYQIGPILDPALFDETIHTAYASPGYTAEYRSAAACILVFCELLGHLNGKSFHQETSQPGSGRRLGQLDLLTEELDLHHLQALLLVIFYDASIQNRKSRHRLLSVACQAIIDMNGHVLHQRSEQPSEDDFSQGLRRYARSIFWHCYRLDKDIALRHGRPPILTQEHCDLTLPEENGTSWLLPDRHSQSMMGHYLSAASRLSVIKEHVCRLLFPASATHIDDNQILLHIRHLDDELEKWRAALPLGIQPRLSIDGDYVASSPSPNSSWGDLALALQLDYSHTFIMIHTAIRKCGHATSDKEDVPEDLHQVIHSSINLSLEAARSTLKLLGHCATTKGLNFPRYPTRYVPPAAFALFLNIVIHPYDRHGPADLTLLTTFVGTVQGSDLGEVADENMELLQRLCEALMEFVRLGNSAIWQAKREARKPN